MRDGFTGIILDHRLLSFKVGNDIRKQPILVLWLLFRWHAPKCSCSHWRSLQVGAGNGGSREFGAHGLSGFNWIELAMLAVWRSEWCVFGEVRVCAHGIIIGEGWCAVVGEKWSCLYFPANAKIKIVWAGVKFQIKRKERNFSLNLRFSIGECYEKVDVRKYLN